jgi:hypothetical protein
MLRFVKILVTLEVAIRREQSGIAIIQSLHIEISLMLGSGNRPHFYDPVRFNPTSSIASDRDSRGAIGPSPSSRPSAPCAV